MKGPNAAQQGPLDLEWQIGESKNITAQSDGS